MEPRVLPHDLDAERSVLGAILIEHPERAAAVYSVAAGILQPSDYYRDAHRQVYECIGGLLDRGTTPDLITVKESLERNGLLEDVGGPAYLGSLVDGVPRSVNVQYYAGIVREKALNRRLIFDAGKMLAAAYAEELPAAELARASINSLAAVEAGGDKTGPRPVLENMADIEARPIRWLWYRRLAYGKLSMLAGDPGLGKSYLTMDLVARLTTGKQFPDGERGPKPINVLLLAAEDDPSDTIKPRLVACGADPARVTCLSSVREGRKDRTVQLSTDIQVIEQAIVDTGAKLVIIDPINAYLGAKIDAYRDNEVRGVLTPLIALGMKHGCALLGVMHLSKDANKSAMYRVSGSVAFSGAPRVVMMVVPDAENPKRRIVAVAKENNGPAPALAYSIDRESGRLEWESVGIDDFDLNGHLAASAQSGGREKGEQLEAEDVIRELLADESIWPLDAKNAFAHGEGLDIKKHQMRRAAKALGIRMTKAGGFGAAGKWIWSRPAAIDDAKDDKIARVADLSSLSPLANQAGNSPDTHIDYKQSPFPRAREDGSDPVVLPVPEIGGGRVSM